MVCLCLGEVEPRWVAEQWWTDLPTTAASTGAPQAHSSNLHSLRHTIPARSLSTASRTITPPQLLWQLAAKHTGQHQANKQTKAS